MHSLTRLAQKAVAVYIREKRIIEPPQDMEEEFFNNQSGVFVTIEKKGALRGCIGTYQASQKNIAQETIRNAIAAATEDYRFPRIIASELDELSFTVSLLGKPEPVEQESDLNPQKYGIIIKSLDKPGKSGLLLPDLPGVETIAEQIAITTRKAGILPEERKIIYRFQVRKYGPEKE